MPTFDYQLLLLRLLPEMILVIGALVVLFLDQATARDRTLGARSSLATFLAIVTLGLAIFALRFQADEGSVYGGMLVISSFTRIAKSMLAILALATFCIGRPARFTTHVGEYVALLLMATVGLFLLAGTEELLTAFIALELTSLSLYLLTGFNKQSILSAEAALKYFLFGSVAAAFTLFGISLIFGLSGSTSFADVATAVRQHSITPLMIVALVLAAIGFAFKMAAAPLHLWAPDTYQGAPIPSAALIASGSKLASFILFLKLFIYALPAQAGTSFTGAATTDNARGWMIVLAAIAAVSVIVGNLLAIAQTNLRRLFAYSAVAHAGYVLIAVLARNEAGLASATYYLFTYGISIIGVFGIIGLLEQRHGELTVNELAGLSRRAPGLALCLFVFVLSLAGIPPLAGFFGKFYIFLAALDASKTANVPGLLWLVALALGASAVSLYYYLQVLKQAFVVEPDTATPTRLTPPAWSSLTLAMLAAAVIYFGCFPEKLVGPLKKALPARVVEQPLKTSSDAS